MFRKLRENLKWIREYRRNGGDPFAWRMAENTPGAWYLTTPYAEYLKQRRQVGREPSEGEE